MEVGKCKKCSLFIDDCLTCTSSLDCTSCANCKKYLFYNNISNKLIFNIKKLAMVINKAIFPNECLTKCPVKTYL